MGTGRNLESPDIAPAKVHPIVAEVGPTVEVLTGNQPVPRADGQLGLKVGMANRNDEFVRLRGLLENFFLDRRILLIDDHRRNRMRQCVGQFPRTVGVILPAEHLVDDVHVTKQVGYAAMFGLAFDVVEKYRAAAV